MAIITLNDQITLISSHLASIKRSMQNGDIQAVATFFHSIAQAATVACEYADNMARLNNDLPSTGASNVGTDVQTERNPDGAEPSA